MRRRNDPARPWGVDYTEIRDGPVHDPEADRIVIEDWLHRPYFGGCSPEDCSHPLMCELVRLGGPSAISRPDEALVGAIPPPREAASLRQQGELLAV